MIRPAEAKDFAAIMDLCEAFAEESGYIKRTGVSFNRDEVSTLIHKAIMNNNSNLAVAELDGKIIGMSCGQLVPIFFNPTKMCVVELVWFVSKNYRKGRIGIKLLKELEDWAEDMGAVSVMATSIVGVSKDKIQKFYESRGYELIENTYIKVLKKEEK